MEEEKQKEIAWRKLNFYVCKGKCGKKRQSLIYLRALEGTCMKCKRSVIVNENQKSIFNS